MDVAKYLKLVEGRLRTQFNYNDEKMRTFYLAINSRARDGIERVSPLISFAYLHRGHTYTSSEGVDIFDLDTNSPEFSLVRKLDAYPEEGLIIKKIQCLPVKQGLRKRGRKDFTLRTETFIPQDRKKELIGYSPVISTVSIGASATYPNNRTGRAKNARKDLCEIGRMIINVGLNIGQTSKYHSLGDMAVPFWMKADFSFLGDKDKKITADGWTWEHMEFFDILRDWI